MVYFGPAILRQLERTPAVVDPRGWQRCRQEHLLPAGIGAARAALRECRGERVPLGRRFAGGQLGAGERRIAQLVEPAEGYRFDDGFVEGHGQSNLCNICTGCLWVLLALHEGNCAVPLGW